MALRERLFQAFTLPSLQQIHRECDPEVDFKVLVIASSELPNKNKEFLERIIQYEKDWISISYAKPEGISYGEHISPLLAEYEKNNFICATARLDDDDALFRGYARELSRLMLIENDKSIVSFSLGYNIYITREMKIIGASEYHHENNSAGLAYIRKYQQYRDVEDDNIYTCGNHTKVSDQHRSISLIDCHSFLRINTETSDRMYKIDQSEKTKRLEIEYRKQEMKIDANEVLLEFRVGL